MHQVSTEEFHAGELPYITVMTVAICGELRSGEHLSGELLFYIKAGLFPCLQVVLD